MRREFATQQERDAYEAGHDDAVDEVEKVIARGSMLNERDFVRAEELRGVRDRERLGMGASEAVRLMFMAVAEARRVRSVLGLWRRYNKKSTDPGSP